MVFLHNFMLITINQSILIGNAMKFHIECLLNGYLDGNTMNFHSVTIKIHVS